MMDKTDHKPLCRCWRCITDTLGVWLDSLGTETSTGRWVRFGTITYATPTYPWARGFPRSGSGRPSPDFAQITFISFVSELEDWIGAQVDYVLCAQFGDRNGRFHQHCLLAGEGLGELSRRRIEGWLNRHAGYSRVLPFRRAAAFYLGNYIGKNVEHADWEIRIGKKEAPPPRPRCAGAVVAKSTDAPKSWFHQNLTGRKK
jgi:hypothetical protein